MGLFFDSIDLKSVGDIDLYIRQKGRRIRMRSSLKSLIQFSTSELSRRTDRLSLQRLLQIIRNNIAQVANPQQRRLIIAAWIQFPCNAQQVRKRESERNTKGAGKQVILVGLLILAAYCLRL
jgi:hypothetical protein